MNVYGKTPGKSSSSLYLEQSDKKQKCPFNEESGDSMKCVNPAFGVSASAYKSRTSQLLAGQRLEMVMEETENQKKETAREQKPDKSGTEINAQCQEQNRSMTATESTCRLVLKRLIGCDNLANRKPSLLDPISKRENPDLMETAFLKFEAKACCDLHKFVKGTLLITSEMLTFLPYGDSNHEDQFNSLSVIEMPRETLRSIALYRDPSVFFFIKRPRHSMGAIMKATKASTIATSQEIASLPLSDSVGSNFDAITANEDRNPIEFTSIDAEYFLCCSVKNPRNVCLSRQNPGNSSRAQWFLIPKSQSKHLHDFLCSHGPNLESVRPSDETFNSPEKPQRGVLPTSSKALNKDPAGDSKPLATLVSSLEHLIPRLNADTKRPSRPLSRRSYIESLMQTAPAKEKRSKRSISIGSSEELFRAHAEVFESGAFLDSMSSPCTPSFTEEKQAFDMLRQASLEWELISGEECTLRCEHSKKPLEIEKMGLLPSSSLLTSHILSQVQACKLFEYLPLRSQGLELSLKYSTEYHGFSLKTLYRRCEVLLTGDEIGIQEGNSNSGFTPQNPIVFSPSQTDQPCLLLIKDSTEAVLGAYMNCPPRMSKGEFYGTGECFVFHWTGAETTTAIPNERENTITEDTASKSPKYFKRYPWSGKNYFFLSGEQDAFIIGCTDGKSAIRIDGNVLRGRTQACGTFDNPELTERGDFFIHKLEVWAFY